MSCLNFFFPLSHLFSLFLMWQCWNKISWNYFEIQTLWKDLSKTPVQSKACCVFYLLVWYGVQIMFGWHFMFGWSWLRFPFNFLIFRLFLFPLGFPHGRNIIIFCSTAWSDCTHLWAPRSSLLHPTWQRKWVMIICTSWTYFNTDCPTVSLTKFFNTMESC